MVKQIIAPIEKALSPVNNFLRNDYVTAVIALFVVLYASNVAPKLPEFITELFNNPVFRVFILFLVAYIANKNPAAALLMSIAFMVTMNVVNRQEVEESFLDIIDTFTGGETGAACDGVSIDSCKSKWTNFNQENADSECGDLHKCCDCLAPTKPELVPTMCQAKEGGGYRVSSSNGEQGVACAEH